MPFDPKTQVRANLARADVAKLAEAAGKLGWPEGEEGASVAGLVRRVCSDWLARVQGVPSEEDAAALPSLAELAARLARVERRLELVGPGHPSAIPRDSRPALPAIPSGAGRDSPPGMPSKTRRESRGPDLSTPEGLRAAMEAKGLSALALSEALGRRDRGRAVARWLDGSAQVPAKHRDKLGDLLA